MPARALTVDEVAAEFGRSKGWFYENWKRLVAHGALPPPVSEAGHLVWSAAQVYAYLDKDLPPKFRALVAAHRAALDAAAAAPAERVASDEVERSRSQLNRRFSRTQEGQ
jgi:hypothetical protein